MVHVPLTKLLVLMNIVVSILKNLMPNITINKSLVSVSLLLWQAINLEISIILIVNVRILRNTSHVLASACLYNCLKFCCYSDDINEVLITILVECGWQHVDGLSAVCRWYIGGVSNIAIIFWDPI